MSATTSAKSPRLAWLDYCRNWPWGEPSYRPAPWAFDCEDTGERIEAGERCAVYRGYWYKLTSPSGKALAKRIEAGPPVLDWFA